MIRIVSVAAAIAITAVHARTASSQGQRAVAAPLSRTDEDGQRAALPPLPAGMTVEMLRTGDAIFRGKGGCTRCHGADATGVAGKGSPLTAGLNYIPKPYSWHGLDSLERAGIPEVITRSQVACPQRGVGANLTDDEVRRVAAYVWAIAQARGEPWPGGHAKHAQ